MTRPTTPAIFALTTLLLSAPGAMATDLPDQRLACQEEARRNIKGPKRVDLDLYRRVVDRRHLFVQECMLAEAKEVDETGSVAPPLPPKAPDRRS
jgi:hypothetical protein